MLFRSARYTPVGTLMAVGIDSNEAGFRAKRLNIPRSHDDREDRVDGAFYRRWWDKDLSDEQRTLMLLAGGSQPPPL